MNLFGPLMVDQPRGPDGKIAGPPAITPRLALGLLGAVLGSFISNLDTRLTSFSLADLRGGVGYGVDETAWVSAAYNIAEIAVVPITPWLSNIISARRAVALAVILLTLAGALVPVAQHQGYVWLVAMRFIQGLGGGALIPLLLGVLLRFTPLHLRIFGFTAYAFVTANTPLISASLAGVLTDIVHWQALFYVGVLIGPIVLGLVLYGLPTEPAKSEIFRSADYTGMLLMVLWPSLLTAALDEGQRLNWFTSAFIDWLFAAAAVSLIAFLVVELSQKTPLITLSLLLQRNFAVGLTTIFAFAFATLLTASVLPQYALAVRGFRELQVGQILIWAALAQTLVCITVPFLLLRLEARIVLSIGLFTTAMGAYLGTYVDSDWVFADILPVAIIQACGQPLIMVPLVVIATANLQMKEAIPGATLFNVVRTLAGTVGGAVVGGITTVRERVHSNTIVDHLVAGAPSTVHAQSAGNLAATVTRQATTMAISDTLGWIGVILLGAMVLPLVLNESRLFRPPARAA
jgi:DHA2 family multidrug resistance protein